MHQGLLRYTDADQQYVAECLGRRPLGVLGVAARDALGKPAVIINAPFIQKGATCQPFPTLYWLVDPPLHTRLAEIERKGGVKIIEQALAQDPILLRAHRQDNALYARTRWSLLDEKEQQAVTQLGLKHILQDSGIGGVANHDTIKCLHTQYAFHLARHENGTTAGRLMVDQFNL